VDYVRESIKRNKEVEFVLVERSSFKRTDLQELVYLEHFQVCARTAITHCRAALFIFYRLT
jgi:hypothetical protein